MEQKPSDEELKAWRAARSVRRGWTVVVSLLAFAVIVPLIQMSASGGVFPLSILSTFFTAMLIGFSGALLYVMVQKIADSELTVLRNLIKGQPDISLLVLIFALSGGVVAGMSQATAGSLEAKDIWTTFLIGFGWQGVITGVGGSSAVDKKDSEGAAGVDKTSAQWNALLQQKEEEFARRLKESQRELTTAAAGSPPQPGVSVGELVGEG